jgi:predicted N-acetyltransferase YhbS
MDLIFRETDISEFFQTESLTREAFWNLYNPGCNEHLVLHQLRKSNSYIKELDLIAIYGDEIIGHIISTKASVIDNQNNKYEVLCAGPFSVLPELQHKGFGSQLFEYSISESRKLGNGAIILFGNPDYYSRFGFVNAEKYGITTKDGKNFDPFMALELQNGKLANVKGRFFEDAAFEIKEEDLLEFEKYFPAKEKGKPKIDISEFES